MTISQHNHDTLPRHKKESNERKSPRFRKFAKKAGVVALAATAALTPQGRDAIDSTVLATYTSAATAFDLPGSEITDTVTERMESKERERLIEVNEAHEIANFQTASGITLEVLQSGLGDNPERPIIIDQEAMEASLDYIIAALDDLEQDAISHEDIHKFQEKAGSGELNRVTMTIIISADAYHCLDENLRSFSHIYDTLACTTAGVAIHRHIPIIGETRNEINPAILVSPAQNIANIKALRPEHSTDDTHGILNIPDTVGLYLDTQMSINSVLTHEMIHGVVTTIDPNIDPHTQHELFVHPITEASDTLMSGQYSDKLPMLEPPVSFKDNSD
jgi:hypothetical protein